MLWLLETRLAIFRLATFSNPEGLAVGEIRQPCGLADRRSRVHEGVGSRAFWWLPPPAGPFISNRPLPDHEWPQIDYLTLTAARARPAMSLRAGAHEARTA